MAMSRRASSGIFSVLILWITFASTSCFESVKEMTSAEKIDEYRLKTADKDGKPESGIKFEVEKNQSLPGGQQFRYQRNVDQWTNKSNTTAKQPAHGKAPVPNCDLHQGFCHNRCTNKTSLDSREECNCDAACGLFMDCCVDYAKICGAGSTNKNVRSARFSAPRFNWICETYLPLVENLLPGGVWMIGQCPHVWRDDVIRMKCQSPINELCAESYDSFIPVFSDAKQVTYRNKHCAVCNNASQYRPWIMNFAIGTGPPEDNTVESLVEFIEKNLNNFKGLSPSLNQPSRYCRTVVSSCSPNSAQPEAEQLCINGTVGLVEWSSTVFKNDACALCNGVKTTCPVGHSRLPVVISKSIYEAINLQDYVPSSATIRCEQGHVYDEVLKQCRKDYNLEPFERFWANYRVIMELKKYTKKDLPNVLAVKKDLALHFDLKMEQINDVKVVEEHSKARLMMTIHLTPLQTQGLTNMTSRTHHVKIENETLGLRTLFNFSEAFEMKLQNRSYDVYNITITRLTCIKEQSYKFGQYDMVRSHAGLRLYVNSTRQLYEPNEYYIYTSATDQNATVCLIMVPSHCNGSYIKLTADEYHIFPNLTLAYHTWTYDFGDYIEKNGTVFICVQFRRNYAKYYPGGPKEDLVLETLNFAGFTASLVCLLTLIVTFAIFKELRTLPGKNLLTLSVTLFLTQLLWIMGSVFTSSPAICRVIAISNHYFFLAFFTASSVIAYHTCLVFGKRVAFRRTQEDEKRLFMVYSTVVYAFPALFVLVFTLLDRYGVFMVDYAAHGVCWLGTRKSKIFLFILPFGSLLVFNFFLFAVVVSRLHEKQKHSAQVLGDGDFRKWFAKHVLVCIKLSTLMSFHWVLALVQALVGDEINVLKYLFVILVSSQGVFISVAFVFKRKILHLYQCKVVGKAVSSNTTTRSTNTRKSYSETKL